MTAGDLLAVGVTLAAAGGVGIGVAALYGWRRPFLPGPQPPAPDLPDDEPAEEEPVQHVGADEEWGADLHAMATEPDVSLDPVERETDEALVEYVDRAEKAYGACAFGIGLALAAFCRASGLDIPSAPPAPSIEIALLHSGLGVQESVTA